MQYLANAFQQEGAFDIIGYWLQATSQAHRTTLLPD